MQESKKFGWTVTGIVGLVFLPVGLVFLSLGTALWHFRAGEDPEDPLIFLAAFGSLGAIFALVALGLLWGDLRRRRLMRRAYESGNYVMAKVADVQPVRNVNRNGRIPYVLECHYTDPGTGVAHIYYSRYLYVAVRDLLTSDQVPVYIDPMNDEVGFVDVDAVLPEIRVHR